MENGKEATIQLHLEATPALLEMVTWIFHTWEAYYKAYLYYSLNLISRY